MKPFHFISIVILLPALLIFFGITRGESQVFRPFKEIDAIPKNKGVIYVYLPSKIRNVEDYVFINGKLASDFPLYEHGCLIYFADSGINAINAWLWSKDDLVVYVNPGESVFIKGLYATGKTSFRQIPSDIARKELMKYKIYDKRSGIKSEKCRSIALISTTISKPVGTNAYNEGVERKLLEDIVKIEKPYLNWIRETTAKELKKYFSAPVIFGDSLNSMPEIKKLKPKYSKSLQFMLDENRSVPYILSDSLDLKPFSHFRGDITKFFKDTANYKPIIREIGQAAKTDIIAVCNTNSFIDGSFIIYLNTDLFLFYPDGSLFATAGKSVRSSQVSSVYFAADFCEALRLFPITLTLTLEEMISDLMKK